MLSTSFKDTVCEADCFASDFALEAFKIIFQKLWIFKYKMGTFPNVRGACLFLIRIDFWQLLTLVTLVTYRWYHILCFWADISRSINTTLQKKKTWDCLQEAKCNTWLKTFGTFCRRKLWWNTGFYQSRKNLQVYICSNQVFNEKNLRLKHVQKVKWCLLSQYLCK